MLGEQLSRRFAVQGIAATTKTHLVEPKPSVVGGRQRPATSPYRPPIPTFQARFERFAVALSLTVVHPLVHVTRHIVDPKRANTTG